MLGWKVKAMEKVGRTKHPSGTISTWATFLMAVTLSYYN
jgi:hypothetical protein